MDRPQLIFVWLLRPNDLNSRIMRFKKKNATLSVSNMNQLWLITENRLIISCKSMKGFCCYQSIDARDSPTKRATITVIRFFFVHLPNIFPQIIPFETECSWFHQNAIELVIDFIPAFDWFDCNSQRTIQSSWFFRCFKTCRRGCRRSKKRYTVEIERDKIDICEHVPDGPWWTRPYALASARGDPRINVGEFISCAHPATATADASPIIIAAINLYTSISLIIFIFQLSNSKKYVPDSVKFAFGRVIFCR